MKAIIAGLLTATALATPQGAWAKPANRNTATEARLNQLAGEIAQLRAELASAKAESSAATARAEAAAATARSEAAAATQQLAAIDARPAPAAPAPTAPAPAEGFRAGNTTIKLGGYIKLLAGTTRFSAGEVATNSLGRDFYLPQTIPTGAGPASRTTDFTAKQSRFWLNLASDVAGHAVKGYVEADFQTSPGTQGSQRTTNGYNLALRRAYLQLDRWTFGQDWTTFQFTGALPESTDYVGGAEGAVFVRQPLVRYSAPLGGGLTLHLGVENPESGTATGTGNAGLATLVENGDDHLPDFTARLAYAGTQGELSLAALGRKIRTDAAGISADTSGYGLSAAGKLYLNPAKTGDVRFMATYGRGIGRYLGLNFAPDAVYLPATNTLASATIFAALGAVRIPLGPGLRANLMGSYQAVDYASALTLAQIGTFNQRAWSGAANLFYSPVRNIDLGVEYRHGSRKLVNGAHGGTDRIEIAAKYSF